MEENDTARAAAQLIRELAQAVPQPPHVRERIDVVLAALNALAPETVATVVDHSRLAEIIETLYSVAALDFTKRAPIAFDESALDGVAAAINMLSEEIGAHIEESARAEEALRRSDA